MFDELNPRMNLLKVTKGKVNTLLIDNVNRRQVFQKCTAVQV
jgi:hypothetical protein